MTAILSVPDAERIVQETSAVIDSLDYSRLRADVDAADRADLSRWLDVLRDAHDGLADHPIRQDGRDPLCGCLRGSSHYGAKDRPRCPDVVRYTRTAVLASEAITDKARQYGVAL